MCVQRMCLSLVFSEQHISSGAVVVVVVLVVVIDDAWFVAQVRWCTALHVFLSSHP